MVWNLGGNAEVLLELRNSVFLVQCDGLLDFRRLAGGRGGRRGRNLARAVLLEPAVTAT
jgi:hypothetical protein